MSSLPPASELPTRQLLAYLKLARKMGGWYSPIGPNSRFGYNTEQLKAELATREHVPNKIEAAAARKLAARGGRSDAKA